MNALKKYTLITGGSRGIGRELARVFAQNGHHLVLVARSQQELDEVRSELNITGVDIITIVKDLFNPGAPFELHRQTTEQNLYIDILVNNAGQGLYGLFENTPIDRELAIIQLNIASLVVLTKLYLQDMLAQGGDGKILNLSSIASKSPGPWQSVYHGTKAFVQSFTEALRSEVKNEGIVVTALLPGTTDTDFFNKAGMTTSKAVQDKNQLADPAVVARDGYQALMNNADMVISGFKNKLNVAVNNLTPDDLAADNMKTHQKPADS